ncbi:arsenate reductase (glutaredoxin) [Gillisia sp. Q332]|uniref:arsenate reductase (glutaredoxin) n=1 Tax=Gillisia xinjiangensis TaxID=3384765 RepID=UPI00391DC631
MITIYHNTRCKKSREGLEILENSGKEFQIREYLKEPLSEKELSDLLEKLSMTPIQLIRTKESIWKEKFQDKDLSDQELITVMAKYPKLIERPILENKNAAVIGRPTVNIENFLKRFSE